MTITPDMILAALHQKLEETFPGEPVYDNLTPRGFQRPSNLLELERTDGYVKAGDRALKVAACWADSGMFDAVEVHLTLSLTVDRADFQPAELLPIMRDLSTKTITSEEEL